MGNLFRSFSSCQQWDGGNEIVWDVNTDEELPSLLCNLAETYPMSDVKEFILRKSWAKRI